jgi:hypothetical protein
MFPGIECVYSERNLVMMLKVPFVASRWIDMTLPKPRSPFLTASFRTSQIRRYQSLVPL